jgi:protoheme IX farnesyltransferase
MIDGAILDDRGRGASASLLAGAELSDWIALLKPRVVSLVVFTGLVGLLIAPGHIHPVLGIAAVLCIAVGAGAAGAINMWYDRDIDAVMRRTARRPIPTGAILPGEALGFGVTLAIGSVLVMGLATNAVAAGALAASILFYVFVYTIWLKRRTPQNIVIGGAAGAFPPLIGWAAVTGQVGLYPLILFLIVFLWTPPHFWSLSLYACGDYTRAGVPMLPVVAGPRRTRWHVLAYAAALLPASLLPWALGCAGPFYGAVAAALGVGFLVCAVRVVRDRQDETGRSLTGDRPARFAFRFSLAYLAILFAAVLVDHWLA